MVVRRRRRRGGIHYSNHFTSLEKVALAAASVKESKTEKDRQGVGGGGGVQLGLLMTVGKSKAQLHFSSFIAFLHEHPEHPHNNQRYSSSILVSP